MSAHHLGFRHTVEIRPWLRPSSYWRGFEAGVAFGSILATGLLLAGMWLL